MAVYKTRDFYLSGFLIADKHKLLKHQRYNGLLEFVFYDTPELHNAIKQYYAAETKIDAMTYSVTIRNLKSLIHSKREEDLPLTISNEQLNHEFVNKQSISA